MTNLTKICGWGRYPQQDAYLHAPSSSTSLEFTAKQQDSVLARGMGRSYGDSANALNVLQTKYINLSQQSHCSECCLRASNKLKAKYTVARESFQDLMFSVGLPAVAASQIIYGD